MVIAASKLLLTAWTSLAAGTRLQRIAGERGPGPAISQTGGLLRQAFCDATWPVGCAYPAAASADLGKQAVPARARSAWTFGAQVQTLHGGPSADCLQYCHDPCRL